MKAQGSKPEKVHEFKLIAYTVHRSMPLLDGSMKYVRGGQRVHGSECL